MHTVALALLRVKSTGHGLPHTVIELLLFCIAAVKPSAFIVKGHPPAHEITTSELVDKTYNGLLSVIFALASAKYPICGFTIS